MTTYKIASNVFGAILQFAGYQGRGNFETIAVSLSTLRLDSQREL